VKAEVFREVSAGWMTVREIEAKFGEEGANAIRFFEKMKLVETKWQTGPTASPEKAYHAFYSSFHINATAPIQEISDVLHAAMMSEESYSVIENRIFEIDRKSTRLNSSHVSISYAVFCLKKKK